MALNLNAIKKAEIFEHNKGELEELGSGATLRYFYVTEKDGEELIAFRVNETDNFYFASGVLKNFLHDNINNAFIDADDNKVFTERIHIRYGGKKKSKNNRMYNDWEVMI